MKTRRCFGWACVPLEDLDEREAAMSAGKSEQLLGMHELTETIQRHLQWEMFNL